MTEEKGEDRIKDLLARAQEKPFEARRVQGHVIECNTLIESGERIFVVNIRNGPLYEMFWVADQPGNLLFYPPRVGDRVRGVVNSFDRVIDFADFKLEAIFDFKNETAENEDAHFAWFRHQQYLMSINSPDVSPVYKKHQP